MKSKVRSFIHGIFTGGIILFLFNLPSLFHKEITNGLIVSLFLILISVVFMIIQKINKK
ncbi:MAG: hypothetical protein ACI4U3_05640 [Traorella sp.]